MNKRITVLIDLDDTLTHLTRAWCRQLNLRHGTNVNEDDVLGWAISDYFPSLSVEQVFAPVHEDTFWQEVEPKVDAAAYVKRLIDEGFDVYICTASLFDTIKSKFDCILSRYFPFVPRENIIVTTNKQLIKGDILIDDGVHNLEGGDYQKILMSASHNRNYDAASHGMTRVESWKEAYDAVHHIASILLREDAQE